MPTLNEKMKTMTGYCSACGAQIIDLSGVRPRLLPNYREHIIELSNETMMRVGVCVTCKGKLVSGSKVKTTANAILANHRIYWGVQKRRPKNFDKLTVSDPNTDEKKFNRARKERRHAEALKKSKKGNK